MAGAAISEAEKKRLEIVEEHMRKCRFLSIGNPGSCMRLKMNPIVSVVSAIVLWGFIIAIAIDPMEMNHFLGQAKTWVADGWSWIYIISQDIWVVVLVYIACHPKYGKLKLGRDDEEPIFSDMTWFSLLFTCGVAVGLFYYVAEPMWHFKGWGGPRFIGSVNGYSHPSEDAVHGLMVTYYHWGIHGWIPYTTVGAVLGLLSYRRGFPMSMRFGFYPLIGDRVYGWMGDAIDILSIVTTIMGVCTSLGLGTMSINMGMQRLSMGFYRGTNHHVPDDPIHEFPTCAGVGHKYWGYVKACDEKWSQQSGEWTKVYDRESYGIQTNSDSQTLIIVVITLLATASVVTGLDRGIRDLSRLGFALSGFLLCFVLFAGDTVFQLNLTVQSIGYYIWYLPKIAFHTDAFELLNTADHGRGGFATQGAASWMDIWTIFYWGWWISWGPFVGIFLAKVSRGRTLRQFVLWTLILPSLYCFAWFGCLGGEIIKQQNLADSSNLCSGWLNGGGSGSSPNSYDAVTGNWATGGMKCNLSPEELDEATGKCKDHATLVADGVIGPNDEPNCGRGYPGGAEACTNATLTKGYCGKMLPTCDHYTATYSPKQKEILNLGFTPPCKLDDNRAKRPALSGKCENFGWRYWTQKGDRCVEIKEWPNVPCGGSDPTAMTPSSLACGSGCFPGNPGPSFNAGLPACDRAAHAACQDACKDKISWEMIDPLNADRLYNHFTNGGKESEATEGIWKNYNKEDGPYQHLDMSTVWVDGANVNDGSWWVPTGQTLAGRTVLASPPCFVHAPDSLVCMWNQKTEDVLFDLLGSLTNSRTFADFVSIIALGSLVIYFITSSDSGSLVVDILAANGEEEPPIPQRIFWAFTEGACAIALLYSGKDVKGPYGDPGEGGLRALQAGSIVMGLPYTFILFWYSQSLVQICREEAGELDPERPRFKMFLMGAPTSDRCPLGQGIVMLLRNLLVPGFSPAVRTATTSWPFGACTRGIMWCLVLQFLWMVLVAFCFMGFLDYSIFMLACSLHMVFSMWVSLIRREIRKQWNIPRGDFITDFVCSALLWPCVLTQLEIEMKEDKSKKTDGVPEPAAAIVAQAAATAEAYI